jgi:hypothetical protein
MLKPYGYRSREQRVNDARANELIRAAKRTANSTANTDLLLGKLIAEVQLSNLLAVANGESFPGNARDEARATALEILRGQA